MKKSAVVYVTGVVQGVGFRPFVYRVAADHGLKGFVSNLRDVGVRVTVEGGEKEIRGFARDLRFKSPPRAIVEKVRVHWRPYRNLFTDFRIIQSSAERITSGSMLPPDISICPDCVDDVFRPSSRWFQYPFTVCPSCGPRFTATYELPYDRPRTNMSEFPPCEDCRADFDNQSNRRFHTQGICCSKCGPKMTLFNVNGRQVPAENPIEKAVELLDKGSIVAIKGLGGMHLATETTEDEPIKKLRRRKRRPTQPFALMSPSLDTVRTFTDVTVADETLLASWQRPIVVLRKSSGYYLSDLVSPGLDTVGVMLPYSGIHLLLFEYTHEPALVMTSANRSGAPMIVDNESAFRDLRDIADYLLLHDRRIVNRCDDSVIRLLDGKTTFLRRSRGYVPSPVPVPVRAPKDVTVIAYGAELRSAAAILKDSKCYPTQYVGDCDTLETLDFLESTVDRLARYLGVTSDQPVIACDLHPSYLSSRLASMISQQKSYPLVRVQHHHAHITSVMAENGVKEPVVGIAVDGLGYGPDGTVWGGEVLEVSYRGFKRVGCLEPLPMPGGDLCTKYPARMLVAGLTKTMSSGEIHDLLPTDAIGHLGSNDLQQLINMSKDGDVALTSSAGRVLDSISAALGICYERTYEGEPAVALESVAARGDPSRVKLDSNILGKNGFLFLETSKLIADAIQESKTHRREDVAASSQVALAAGLAEMAVEAANSAGIKIVGISGGVAVNAEIVGQIQRRIAGSGLNFVQHTAVPPGDGCIALGQCMVASSSFL